MQQDDTGGPHIKQVLGFPVWSLHIHVDKVNKIF